MLTTIKAKSGYKVRRYKENSESWYKLREAGFENPCVLRDGDEVIMVAELVTYPSYCAEREQNEAFNFCECFVTEKGNRFVYWRDEEIDLDCLTKLDF